MNADQNESIESKALAPIGMQEETLYAADDTGEWIVEDAELLKNHLPEGSFVVRVADDSFDDDIFECYAGEDADKKGWTELLVVDGSPAGAYVVQGLVVFVKKEGLYGEIETVTTNDTAVKTAEDVRLLMNLNNDERSFSLGTPSKVLTHKR